MDENEEPNIIIIKLMPILLNKLRPNRLEFKELTTTSLKVGE